MANDVVAQYLGDPSVGSDLVQAFDAPMNGQFASVLLVFVVCAVGCYLLLSRRGQIGQTPNAARFQAKGNMVPRKFWAVFAAVVVFAYVLMGQSAAVLVVGAAGCYLLLRLRSQGRPSPMACSHLAQVQYAVGVLTNEQRRIDLFRVVDLSVASKDKHGRVVRRFPTVFAVAPTVFGASVEVSAVDGQELADYRRAASRLATALMVPSVVISESSPGYFRLDLSLDPPTDLA